VAAIFEDDIVMDEETGGHLRAMSALPIDKIQIGTRHRREMGDIASLAGSMGELGLLQPVVVRDQSAPS
jgi:hypothetical protein